MRLLPAVLFTTISLWGQTYTISTFAGGGAPGLQVNIPGTSASLGPNPPQYIAADRAGNLFFAFENTVLRWDATADVSNNRIRKVAGGVISTVAGGGTLFGDNLPATSAQLTLPNGVAVDSAGDLYLADTRDGLIRKVSNGVIATVAGNRQQGFSGDNGPPTGAALNFPAGIAFDPAGGLYIADTGNNRIRKVANRTITTVAGGGDSSDDNVPATSAQLYGPSSVAVDAAGNLYFPDANRIRRVSNGVIATVAGNGVQGYNGDNIPATSAQLERPWGVAVDSAGNLFITEAFRVRKVSNGVITTVAGNGTYGFSGDNGPATSAQLFGPTGIVVDSAGKVYIADAANNRIRVLTPPPPVIRSVVNAASFVGGAVSPGELVTIFGTGIGPAAAGTIGGVQVLFSGIPAPMIYASSTQVSAVVPYEIASVANPSVRITYEGQTSDAYQLSLPAAAPGLFSQNASGGGQGAILNQDNTLNWGANLAAPGSIVQMFLTGEGQTNPPGITGAITTTTLPPPQVTPAPTQPIQVWIGGQPAVYTYAGEAPGMVAGVMQINVRIPANVQPGLDFVVVSIGGKMSQGGITVSLSGAPPTSP